MLLQVDKTSRAGLYLHFRVTRVQINLDTRIYWDYSLIYLECRGLYILLARYCYLAQIVLGITLYSLFLTISTSVLHSSLQRVSTNLLDVCCMKFNLIVLMVEYTREVVLMWNVVSLHWIELQHHNFYYVASLMLDLDLWCTDSCQLS